MKYMSQYKILQVRYWYSKHNFQRSPILLEFPTFLRYVSVYYLAFSAVSINKRNIIIRKTLPILNRILATKYVDGLYEKLLTRNIMLPIWKEDARGIERPSNKRSQHQVFRSINNYLFNMYSVGVDISLHWRSLFKDERPELCHLLRLSNMVRSNAKPYAGLRVLSSNL